MRSQLLRFTLVTLFAAPLCGATLSLIPPAQRQYRQGAPLHLTVVVINDADELKSHPIPPWLDLQWAHGTCSVLHPQSADGGIVSIPRGQFKKITYVGVVPSDVAGETTVTVTAGERVSWKIDLEVQPPPTYPRTPAEHSIASINRNVSRLRQATRRFATHEPIYFAIGPREGSSTSRFQLSFKYRLGDYALRNLYFTHTTLSVWDHFRYSGPFRDISHMPGLTLHFPNVRPIERGEFDLWFGYEHESNGRGALIAKRDMIPGSPLPETESRSTNRAYFRPVVRFGQPDDDLRLFFAPKFSKNIKIAADNRDLVKYRGVVDWVATMVLLDACAITGTLRRGSDGWNAQMDLAIRLSKRNDLPLLGVLPLFNSWKPPGWLLFQYFEGHGETFLEYNSKGPSQWRIGYMLTPWFDARAADIDGR